MAEMGYSTEAIPCEGPASEMVDYDPNEHRKEKEELEPYD